jgi:NAD(P)H-dependent FMN reductase
MSPHEPLKLSIIVGSHRPQSQSAKVGHFLRRLFLRNGAGREAFLHDLAESPMPFWDEGVWNGTEQWTRTWEPVSQELAASDGLVLVTPEWGGMATPALKNFLLLCSNGVVRHRPVLLVSVSASRGGAYPIAELRMTSGKNSQLCFIPEHIIVRQAAQVLNDDEAPANEEDAYLRGRLLYSMNMLVEYSRALRLVRASPVMQDQRFRYGM